MMDVLLSSHLRRCHPFMDGWMTVACSVPAIGATSDALFLMLELTAIVKLTAHCPSLAAMSVSCATYMFLDHVDFGSVPSRILASAMVMRTDRADAIDMNARAGASAACWLSAS